MTTLLNPVLSRLSGHADPIVLEPFDVTLCYPGVPRTPNLLKISSDIESNIRNGLFSTLRTDLKVEWTSMTIISKLTRKCIWCYHRVQWCVTTPHSGGKLCSGALKRGQGSHVAKGIRDWIVLSKGQEGFHPSLLDTPTNLPPQSHCGDKTILRSSYLHNGISYTGKMTSLYWIRAHVHKQSAE